MVSPGLWLLEKVASCSDVFILVLVRDTAFAIVPHWWGIHDGSITRLNPIRDRAFLITREPQLN